MSEREPNPDLPRAIATLLDERASRAVCEALAELRGATKIAIAAIPEDDSARRSLYCAAMHLKYAADVLVTLSADLRRKSK